MASINLDKANALYGNSPNLQGQFVDYLRNVESELDFSKFEGLDNQAIFTNLMESGLKSIKVNPNNPAKPLDYRPRREQTYKELKVLDDEINNQPFYKDLAMRATQVLDQINPTPFRQKELETRRHKAQEILNHLKKSGVTSEQFQKEYGDSPFLREAYFENQDIFNNIFDLSHDASAALFGGKNAQAKAYDFELESYNTYKAIAQRKLDNPSNYYKLSPQERATIEQRVGAIGSWWRNNSDKELVDYYLDLENAKESASNFVSAQKRLENVNSNEQFLGLIGALKHGKDFTKQQKAMIDDYAIVAKELGFDTLAYNKTGLYFIKDEKAYKVEQGLWDEIKGVFKDNIGSLAGAIAGAEYGYKKGKFKGMVAYGAAGAFGGGVTDSMIADVLANKKIDLAQALIHGAQEGALNIAADAVLKVAGTAIKTLNPQKLKNIAGTAIDYTPVLGFINRAHDGNKAAAQKLINTAMPKEVQAELKELESIFGASVEIGQANTSKAAKALESIKQRLGSDSTLAKGAQKFYDTFAFTDQKQAQKDFIRAIRADESGNLTAFLSEAANASPTLQKSLQTVLGQTTEKLLHQLERFELAPNTIKDVFNNFEKGTKDSYKQAIEDILQGVYDDSYRVVLSREKPNYPEHLELGEMSKFNTQSYDSFKQKMLDSGVMVEDSAKFLHFVESSIYNPKGVTFESLNNALKTINAYHKQASDPNFRSFVKDAVNGFIKRDIQAGIEAIFAQNKALYNDARTLFDTALSDYAKMKETLKLVDKLKVRDRASSYEQVANSLSRFFLAQGDSIPNFEALLGSLPKHAREQVELKLLQDMLEISLVRYGDSSALDSSEFFKRLDPLKAHFQSKSAQDFIAIAQDFHTLFRNDAKILNSLAPTTTEKMGSSIATTLEGAIKFQVIKALFANVVRLLPHIPFAKGLNEKVQGAALRFHLKKALDSSLSVGEFKLELQARAIKGDFTNATREQIAKILGQVDSAQESLEKAITPSEPPKALDSSLKTSEIKQELLQRLEPILNKPLTNAQGVQAYINHASIDKMLSDKAIAKSVENGFSKQEHLEAVGDIERLFSISQEAATHNHKGDNPSVIIHRLNAPFKNANALITTKESLDKDKNRIYSVELELTPRFDTPARPTDTEASKGSSSSLNGQGGQDLPTIAKADEKEKTAKTIDSSDFTKGETLPLNSSGNSTTLSPLEHNLTPKEIKDIVSKWDLSPSANATTKQRAIISQISDTEAQQLQKDFNFKGKKPLVREIDSHQVIHTLKQHGDEISETQRGQEAIGFDDIANYETITQKHDMRITQDNGKILYAKQVNGHFIVVEEVLEGQDKVRFFDMWKQKGKLNKGVLLAHSQRPNTNPSPSLESRMPSNTSNSTTLSPLEQAQAQKQATQAAQEAAQAAQAAKDEATAQAIKDRNDQIQHLKDSRAGKGEMEREVQLGQPIVTKRTEQPPTSIATDDNNIYQLDFVIVKASDVKPNFNADGLQPRTQKEHKTIESIAQNFKPEMMLGRGGYKDLPIIAKDGQVITGNHRVQGFKDFTRESRAAYEKAIKERFNIELASDELLLRTPSDDLSVKELLSIAYNSNKEDIKNLGDHIYSVLGRYAPNFEKLPRQLESTSVQELKSKIARILDNSPYPNENDANLALLANTIKADKNANITEMLNSFSKLDKEDAQKTLSTFTDTAGLWHILSNNAVEYGLKQLDLRPYLLGAMYKSATSQHTTRAANFKELNAQIKHILDTTDSSGSNMMLEIMPNTYDNLIADLLGASLARFMRLENPSANLYETLKGANNGIREQLAPRLDFETGWTTGKNIEQADIFDFIEYMIRQGESGKEVNEAVELLPKLREKYEAFKGKDSVLGRHSADLGDSSVAPPSKINFTYTTGEAKSIVELRKDLKAALEPYKSTPITNKETGLQGVVTIDEINKIASKKAVDKSVANGFSRDEHFAAAQDLKNLFENATKAQSHNDYKQRENIAQVHRFVKDLYINDKQAQAKITLFEKIEGKNRIYTLELESLNKPDPLSASVPNTESAAKAQSVATARPETTTIAKTDGEIIPQTPHQDGELLKKEYHRLKKEYDNLYNEKTKQLDKGLNPTKEQIRQIEKAYRVLSKVENRIFKEITQPARDFYVNFLTKYGNKSYFESLARQPIIRLGGKEELTTAADEIDSLAQDLVLLKQDLFKGIPETKTNQDFARKTRLKMEKAFNIKPIAEFGENYAEYYRDGVGAIEKLLLERNGQVSGAFYRKELGDIDVVWGDSNFGLAHIIERRMQDFINQGMSHEQAEQAVKELLDKIPQILEGQIYKDSADKVEIITDKYTLVIGKRDERKFIITELIDRRNGKRMEAMQTRVGDSFTDEPLAKSPLSSNRSDSTTKTFNQADIKLESLDDFTHYAKLAGFENLSPQELERAHKHILTNLEKLKC